MDKKQLSDIIEVILDPMHGKELYNRQNLNTLLNKIDFIALNMHIDQGLSQEEIVRKINDYVKQIQDKCNEIWYANTYNLMSIKNKDDMLNYKAKEYINIDKQINELSTSNIKLKSENELLKGKSQNYDILQSQYHELSKENQIIKRILKENDILDTIMDVVQKVLHPPKSQNRGLSL